VVAVVVDFGHTVFGSAAVPVVVHAFDEFVAVDSGIG